MSAESSDPPPSYAQATGSSSTPGTTGPARNRIPSERRRSMEDEHRPLPDGWIRQFDSERQHQFFVNTKSNPPRSIWHHPYDDEDYLRTLPSEERERIESLKKHPSQADIAAESTDDEAEHQGKTSKLASSKPATNAAGAAAASSSSSRPAQEGKSSKFGRRMKDKLTGTTHEERERMRIQRAREEEEAYQQHMRMRQAMARAEQTGEPQLIGKDRRTGQDVYIEPSYARGGYIQRPGATYYNPYGTGSPYSYNPNARYIRPANAYGRPYGSGYGGGLGLPLLAGATGGLLLGGLLGGF